MGDNIKALPSLFIDGLSSALHLLIIPKSSYLKDNFDGLLKELSTKLSLQSYTDFFNVIKSESGSRMENVTIVIMGHKSTIINFDYFYQFKADTDRWVRGFLFALMVLFNGNMIYKLIRGDSFINGGGQGMLSVDSQPQISSSRQHLLK